MLKAFASSLRINILSREQKVSASFWRLKQMLLALVGGIQNGQLSNLQVQFRT